MKGTAKYSLCYIGHNTMYGYNIHVFLHIHIMMYYAINSYRYIVKIRNLSFYHTSSCIKRAILETITTYVKRNSDCTTNRVTEHLNNWAT